MSTAEKYNQIAHQYDEDLRARQDREFILVPSVKLYLGDVKGLKVLDLGCGSGYFTRLIRSWGASEVFGIDISKEMINLARKYEADKPADINYQVGDASDPLSIDYYDLVFAGFLLHYSSSIKMLKVMCESIARNLKPTGRFISLTANPFNPIRESIINDLTVTCNGELKDGAVLTRTHYKDGQPIFSFDHYHYSAATYENALKNVGFKSVKWQPVVRSDESGAIDMRKYKWTSTICVLECHK